MVAICRLCASLKKSDTLTFIRDNNHDLCSKLLKCCHLKIDLSNSVLPQGVCPDCIRNLNASFEFYDRVHESQETLERLLNVKCINKNKNEGVSTSEEENFEEKKLFKLISFANASNVKKTTIETNAQISNKKAAVATLTSSAYSSGSNDIDVSLVNADNESSTEHQFQKAVYSKKKELQTSKNKVYEVVIPGKSSIQCATNADLRTAGDSYLDEATAFEENETEEDYDSCEAEYEIIDVVEEIQSKIEDGNVSDVDKPLRSSSYLDFDNPNPREEGAAKSDFLKDEMSTSTWFDYIWKCVHCSETFSSSSELAKHYEYIEEKEPVWSCCDCLKVFPRYYSLINHIRQRHRRHLGLLCDICNETCESFAELDNHRQSVHDDLIFKMLICSKCGKGFNNTNSLQIHSKCHLPDDMRLQFNCHLCCKNFRSSSSLKFHQKMHAGLKDFVCDQCGKKFIQKANLEEHLITHIEFTPYECDVCRKLFKTSDRLSKHKTRHTDDKPYKCDWTECEKTFRTKDAMNSHMRIHTGEMPFQCEFCQKPFRFRSTLLTHHNTHTGIRPYSCNECNHQFTNWPNYNKHMKRRHGIDVSSKNPRGKKPSQRKININQKIKDPLSKTTSNQGQKFEVHEFEEEEDFNVLELENVDAEYDS